MTTIHQSDRDADPVVAQQRAEYEAWMAKFRGSDLPTRKRRLQAYLNGFSGAYGETRCTPVGDLRLLLQSQSDLLIQIKTLREALERVRKVRESYASQMKFCDIEAMGYFREFVQRIARALTDESVK